MYIIDMYEQVAIVLQSSKDGGIIDEKYSFSHARIPKDHWVSDVQVI